MRFGRATLRHVGIGLAVGVAIGGVAGAVAADPRGGLLIGAAIGIVIGSTVGLEAPVDRGAAVSPRDLLASNRLLTVRRVLLVGVAGGLLGGLAAGVSFGAAFGLAGAWGQWLLFGRVWLPLTGRLPWRTSAFLEDAHERGILRQSGASYQFRHARLQDRLAAPDDGP